MADVLLLLTLIVHAESVGAVQVLALALINVLNLLELGLSNGSRLSESEKLGFLLVVGLLEEDLGDLLSVEAEHVVDVLSHLVLAALNLGQVRGELEAE